MGLISNPAERQSAGSVPADTGIVARVASGEGAPVALWQGRRVRQRYRPGTNVLRTVAVLGRTRVTLTDAARGRALAREIEVRGVPGEPLRLLLGLNLARAGACRPTGAQRAAGEAGMTLEWRGRGRIVAGSSAISTPPGRGDPRGH